jgi:hypothetical protein
MEIYDWDTVVVDSSAASVAVKPLLAAPVLLCTAYFPCSLRVDGRGRGVLKRSVHGTINCISSSGCMSIFIQSLRVDCDGLWAPGSLLEVDGAVLRVSGTTFSECAAQTDGGTIKGYGGGASIIVEGSSFVNSRSAQHGGAVAMLGGLLSVSNTSFVGCTSSTGGGAISVTLFTPRYGSTEDTQVSLRLSHSTFVQCGSIGTGGAIVVSSAVAMANVMECVFNGCYSEDSGGACAVTEKGNLTITRSKFQANRASISGGALYVNHAPLTLLNVEGANNAALLGGGGVLYWTGENKPLIIETAALGGLLSLCGFGNAAVYGNCLASTYMSLELQGLPTAEGPAYPGVSFQIKVVKKDAYDQTITTDSSSLVQALSIFNKSGSMQGETAAILSGALGSFAAGVAQLNIQVKPFFSSVVPVTSTAILREHPAIMFKAVDAETLEPMRSSTITVTMTSGSAVCPVGSILSLDLAQDGSSSRGGACSVCGPGTYSVSPLAGIGSAPKQPACLNCPQTATCDGGSSVKFTLGNWILQRGMYVLISCPANYQLINLDDMGMFQHDLQRCRQCQANEYNLNPNSSSFSCQICPSGANFERCQTISLRSFQPFVFP